MQYLIIRNDVERPFFTKWFDADNHFTEGVDMIVFDLHALKYTMDGYNWHDVTIDHL